MSEDRAAQVRQLAAGVLPDAKLAEAHVAATYERMLEATGKCLVRLELLKEVQDQEEVRVAFLEYVDRAAKARAAILDHIQACTNLCRMWAE